MEKTKLKLTKEQYDKLNNPELEWFLTTAYKSQFITGLTTKQAQILFEIYNEVYKQHMKPTSCSQCRLDVCTKLGKLFFEYRDEYLNGDVNGEINEDVNAEKPKPIKKKKK